MKRILFIVVMLLSLKATSQITNITGAEPRANLVVTTVTAGKYVLVAEKSGTGQRKLYWVDIDSVSSGSGGGGGGGGATPQLDNLGTTSINAALLPQVGIDLGSTTLPFRNIRFYGSGTFGSHSFNLAGTPTGHRTITFPDADISVARTNASQTFTGVQTFSSNPVFSAVSTGQVPYATTAGAITSSNNLYFSGTRLIVNGNTETGNIFTLRRDLTGIYSFMRMNNTSDAATGGYIDFGDAASTGFYPNIIYATDNTTGIYTLHNYRVNDGASSIGARYNVANQAGSSALANASAKLFSWESNGTAKMTMDIDGDLGIGTATPAATAIVDLTSTTKGFLPPRMTGTQAEAISSPAEGLLIYSTDGSGSTITSKGWWGYEGSTWVKLN